MALLSWNTKKRLLQRIQGLVARHYAGVGTILAFHRIAAEPRRSWRSNQEIENPADFLEQSVQYLKREGYEFIPLSEVPARLRAPAGTGRPRFAVVTFDDGYCDTFTTAYPLLKSHGVPFTVYVTTHFVDRTAALWWYLLEDALDRVSALDVEFRGQRQRLPASSAEDKRAAFATIEAMFLSCTGVESADLASRLFGAQAIRESCDRLMMTWDQVAELGRSGLVTVGAHSCRHLVLSALTTDEARAELRDSRQELEARLGTPVAHLAFPYGSRGQAGPREARLARECGFVTATTTRPANLFAEHLDHLHALPRVYPLSPDFPDFPLVVSGTVAAWRYRGRRVVTMD